MPTYEDKIDLYGADGKLLESDVPLEAVSPMLNPTIENIVQEVKRSVAVNLSGIEKSLEKAAYGGKSNFIPGRELKLPIVENVDIIAEKIEKMIRVDDEDDFNLKLINKGTSFSAITFPKTKNGRRLHCFNNGHRISSCASHH